MKALFIFNPFSGKAQIRNNLCDIIDIFVKAGYEVNAHPTQCKKDATNIVKENAKDYDLIICSGGDGTLDETVSGLMQSGVKIPIGYIPAGSTNDFANSLSIPSNMVHAASIAANGKRFSCDIGKFNDEIFVYVAAFGLFTEVSYETPQEIKNVLGHAAYVLEGIKQIQNVKSYEMKFTCDDRIVRGDFIYGMVTNSFSVGGFKMTSSKSTELDDGLFEVTLIRRPANMIELNLILAALVNENVETDLICSFKTRSLKADSSEEVAWTLDGEFGGKHTQVEMQNLHKAIDIIIDKKES